MPCDSFNTPIAAPQGAVLQSFQHLSLCGVNVAFSSVTFWHFLLVFLLHCSSGETLSLTLYPSALSALFSTRVKLRTRRMIFIQSDQPLRRALCYVTRYIRRKGINSVMSNNQKKACGVASGPRDNWIKEEREGRPCATERILISSNFLCFAHTAFYQLLPDWLSCPACIIASDDWQARKRFWYLNV